MAKTRLRRKDLRKPDEFLTLTGRVLRWLQAHRHVTIAVGAVAAALLLGVGVTAALRAARQRDANADLARALAALRATDLPRAAEAFAEAARRWDRTRAGQVAAVLAVNTELRLGHLETAIAAIGPLLAADGLTPYLRQQLLFALGNALERKAQWSEAAAQYAAAGDLGGPYTAQAVLGEARTRAQAGEAERARELYRKYVEQFPDAPDREIIRARHEP